MCFCIFFDLPANSGMEWDQFKNGTGPGPCTVEGTSASADAGAGIVATSGPTGGAGGPPPAMLTYLKISYIIYILGLKDFGIT